MPEQHLRGIEVENVTFGGVGTGWACRDCDGCEAVCGPGAENTTCAF